MTIRSTVVSRSAVVLTTLAAAAVANAQLSPDRLYYGVDRPVPMTVKVPNGLKGEAAIQLLAPPNATVIATAPVTAGGVDLAGVFPNFWRPESAAPAGGDGAAPPAGEPMKLMYAQLVVGEQKVGPAVVIQPLRTPRYARFDPRSPNQWSWFDSPVQTNAGVRAWVDKNVVLETTVGSVEIMMRPDVAPNTVFNFLHLAEGGFYTDVVFHRIADFMRKGKASIAQVGDPSGTGEGGPGYAIDLEDSSLPHEYGVLSMARTPEQNSAGSQIFIILDREAVVQLDGRYTTFAQAIGGADTLAKIAATNVDPETQKPVNAPKIVKARTVDAKPYGGVPAFLTPPQSDAAEGAPR